MEQRNSRKGGPRRSEQGNSNKSYSKTGNSGFSKKPNDRKSFGSSSSNSERKPFKSFGTDKPNFSKSDNKPGSGFDKKKRFDGKNTDFRKSDSSSDRKPYKSFGNNKPSFPKTDRNSDSRPSFGKSSTFGSGEGRYEKPRFNDDKPGGFKKRETFGDASDRKPFGNKRFDKGLRPHDSSSKPNFGDNPAYRRRDTDESTDARGKKRDPQDKIKDIRKNFVSKSNDEKGTERGGIKTPDYVNAFKTKAGQNKRSAEEKKEGIRLNRFIANSGVCSRRDADMLISTGEITVNGKHVTEMGYIVQPTDVVKYSGRTLKREKNVYVLLNKPKDFITTTTDPDDRRTVMDLVAGAAKERLFPVGRLDRNTTGLLLLTNDGDLAETLSHPSNSIKKIYQVTLDKPLDDRDFEKIQAGVHLEDGVATVDDIAIITPDRINIGLEIHIGRNRIVRRIFESLGYEVEKLDRVLYAELTKRDLPRGNWRYLTEKEVILLKNMNKKKRG